MSDRTLEHWCRLYTPFRMLIFRDYGCGNVCNEESMSLAYVFLHNSQSRITGGRSDYDRCKLPKLSH